MRTSTLIVLLCLSVSAFAAETNLSEKLGAMVTMTAKASDAVDAALQVLYDLRQANFDSQDVADAKNKTDQASCDSEIADLLAIADANKASGDATTAHRKFIEQEIADTIAYIEWIGNRRIDIDRKQVELMDQRCYSNGIFVRALKEHSDALAAIDILRNDMIPTAESREGGDDEELVQVKDATAKLASYKHLFNDQALKEFEQLATSDIGDEAEVNRHEGNQLVGDADEAYGAVGGTGPLTEQILALLDRLEEHLEEALSTLEANEVQAAWDLAVWLQDSEAEKAHLDREEEKRNVYLDKLQISVQAARAHENKAWEIYFQSASAYNNAVRACIHLGEEYMDDKHRRNDEQGLIEEVIKIFKEKVATYGRSFAEKKLDTSDLGNVAKNVEEMARYL